MKGDKKIAVFIAHGYGNCKSNVDALISELVLQSNSNNCKLHVYVGWNSHSFGVRGVTAVNGYSYPDTETHFGKRTHHKLSVVNIDNEPKSKQAQKAYYTWYHLLNFVCKQWNDTDKYDKYFFFKDRFNRNRNEKRRNRDINEQVKLKDWLSIDYNLLIADHYIDKTKNYLKMGYLQKETGGVVRPDTSLIGLDQFHFELLKDSGWFGKGPKKKQFPLIKIFMPKKKVYSSLLSQFLNI